MPSQNEELKKQLNEIFRYLTDSLDISESHYKLAVNRYQAIGNWLERDESTVVEYEPLIYPQGSFRLGTVIKPITNSDDYDIDLVCQVNLSKNDITQKKLKGLIGNEVKAYAKANNMKNPVYEGGRCWKLEYADGANFHMDILPAIPDDEDFKSQLLMVDIPEEWAGLAIAITDKKSTTYEIIDNKWPRSNPRGFAEWFKDQMRIVAEPRLKELVKSMKYAKVEEVPVFEWKTPLQRSIQILKRHRDVMFEKDSDNKPASIIITTLAAHAYENEDNIVDALSNIIEKMPNYIKDQYGNPVVSNPVNPDEDFADKWEEHPEQRTHFFEWLNQVKRDRADIIQEENMRELSELLKSRFGESIMEKAVTEIAKFASPAILIHVDKPPHVEIKNPNKPWSLIG